MVVLLQHYDFWRPVRSCHSVTGQETLAWLPVFDPSNYCCDLLFPRILLEFVVSVYRMLIIYDVLLLLFGQKGPGLEDFF